MANIQKREIPEAAITNFSNVYEQFIGLATEQMPENERSLKLINATMLLEDAITPEVLESVKALRGKNYGFKTDKDSDYKNAPEEKQHMVGYPDSVFKSVLVEAALWGARPTNNEFNIISSSCYLCKNFWKRAAEEMTGGTIDVDMALPVIKPTQQKTSIAEIRWRANGIYKGNKFHFSTEEEGTYGKSPVIRKRVFDGSGGGDDQAKGKAEKEIYKYICSKLEKRYGQAPDGDLDTWDTDSSVEADGAVANGTLEVGRKSTKATKSQQNNTFDDTAEEPLNSATQNDATEVPPDACNNYADLLLARNAPHMREAIDNAREKHDECCKVKTFADIDHTNETQCGLITSEYRRVCGKAKSK